MSYSPIITVDRLAKAYRIGLRESTPDTLVGAMTHWAKAPLRNWRRLRHINPEGEPRLASGERSVGRPSPQEVLWALQDVSFAVEQGAVVGILGRNGAGKSTLLKILSRITEPTRGRAVLRGRVSSLLEVGTGFHPELTGRDNVYMNGTILGMTRSEIDRKFDEIVDFSGVEKFLDTPIKRYSSGMQMRLAFAVAAHLEPEILVIDEVLAVGDVEFQKKCIGKMGQVAKGGRTVLFVSHNMGMLQTLCDQGLVLVDGRVSMQGSITEAVAAYLRQLEQDASVDLASRSDRQGAGNARLVSIDIHRGARGDDRSLATGQPAEFVFHVSAIPRSLQVSFTIYDQRGTAIGSVNTRRTSPDDHVSPDLVDRVVCRIDTLPLLAGRYYITAALMRDRVMEDHVEAAAFFDVDNSDFRGRAFHEPQIIPGPVCFDHAWSVPC